uniref:Small ribosomal subunit protein uS3m n=1 Tax=Nephroselmis olivacea TaxID=31312 RepID=Q9TCB0_NEPOL|nr:ribosomal protein S3 [Nephroselmis olivacea]AAF03187.1 ribosomal protein S3 [Nephroselmis olivacea]
MGQKVNPISLRLPINRSVDCLWFSDIHSTKLMIQYLHFHKYIESIFQVTSHLNMGRFFLDVFPKKWTLSCLVHERKNLISKGTRFLKKSAFFNKNVHPLGLTNLNSAGVFAIAYQQMYIQSKLSRIYSPQLFFLSALQSFLQHNYKVASLCLESTNQGKQRKNFRISQPFLTNNFTRKWLYPKDSFLQQVESSINKNVDCSTQVFLMKSSNSLSSANFFVKEITYQLEKKSSINQIWNQVMKKVIQTPSIQGIRLSVAGRINGVEMARTEIRKYGQTSLHSLSNKMDYACSHAYTPFGILGVKIWICFR